MDLAVNGLTKSFGDKVAVNDVTLRVVTGEIYGLIGPNGAGKSTLFNCLTGHLSSDSGTVQLGDGLEITDFPPNRICREGIARTFQITKTYESMSVIENVLVSWHGQQGRFLDIGWRRRDEEAEEALRMVGLREKRHQPSASLSHPDLKRLEVAMALVSDPSLLLLDEPTAGMSATERKEIVQAITDVHTDRSVTVMIVEHDMETIFSLCTRIGVLHQGRLVVDGNPDEIERNPRIQEIYLGEEFDA